jgi:hypothetical protein
MAARRDNYMALYIVVHHPCDPHQPYANEWDRDTQLLRSIETTPRFVREHADALRPGARILIHRCGWGDYPPVICCSVEVEEVTPYFIRVTDVRLMDESPPLQPRPGCGYYEYGQ